MVSDPLESSERSELSSIASSLEQISRRVTAMADAASKAKRDEAAMNLIAVERALLGAVRRLERLMASGR
jgi:RNA polymerase-binding transcription factor DksA